MRKYLDVARLFFDDPVDRGTCSTAAEAVPEVFVRSDDQAGGGVFMKGATICQVTACFLELDADASFFSRSISVSWMRPFFWVSGKNLSKRF